MQKGQTCLFECFYYLDNKHTVDEYIEMLAPEQNVYDEGYSGSAAEVLEFTRACFDVIDTSDWTGALRRGARVLTTVPAEEGRHAVVLLSIISKGINIAKDNILFYNPAFGKTDVINYLDFVNGKPGYAISIKVKP